MSGRHAGPLRRVGRSRRATAAVVGSMLAAGWLVGALFLSGTATPAWATVTPSAATVVDPAGAVLTSGGSATNFSMSLAAQGDAIQGESSEAFCADYSPSAPQLLDSYLVPEGTDPSTVTFDPYPSTGGGLFESTGYYGSQATASGTGELPTIPEDFEWGYVVSSGIVSLSALLGSGTTPGVWEAGLACVNGQGDVTTLWNFQVTFAPSGSDPGGFTWTVPPPATSTPTTTTTPGGGSSSGSSGSSGSGSAGASTATTTPTSTGGGSTEPDFGAANVGGDASDGGGTAAVGSAASDGSAGGTRSTREIIKPGSNSSVKDPGVLRDSLAAAWLSSPRGVAIDLLVAGLILLAAGTAYRRRVRPATAEAPGQPIGGGPSGGSMPDDDAATSEVAS